MLSGALVAIAIQTASPVVPSPERCRAVAAFYTLVNSLVEGADLGDKAAAWLREDQWRVFVIDARYGKVAPTHPSLSEVVKESHDAQQALLTACADRVR